VEAVAAPEMATTAEVHAPTAAMASTAAAHVD
jgi:hypothetical protein